VDLKLDTLHSNDPAIVIQPNSLSSDKCCTLYVRVCIAFVCKMNNLVTDKESLPESA